MKELHSQVYGATEKISLYRRMQRMGYYWPNMNKRLQLYRRNIKDDNFQ